MRVFVSEYVCSGAWSERPLDVSLAREGRSMLLAACADFARILGCEVGTTWDARLGAFPLDNVAATAVQDARAERSQFDTLAAQSDATFVIAPEFDGLLARRCARVSEVGGRLLGPSCEAVELCADKLRLCEHLRKHGLPTIETDPWEQMDAAAPGPFPFVVKPRDGAGSQHTFLVSNVDDLEEVRRVYGELSCRLRAIRQPHIAGRSMSVGVIIGGDPPHFNIFPPAEQLLSSDGRFRYLGGRVSGGSRLCFEHKSLIRRVCESISGLSGYVGIDFILPQDEPTRLVIVEINPRLTTSYLGYREITCENLMARLVNEGTRYEPMVWHERAVKFLPDGTHCATELVNCLSPPADE